MTRRRTVLETVGAGAIALLVSATAAQAAGDRIPNIDTRWLDSLVIEYGMDERISPLSRSMLPDGAAALNVPVTAFRASNASFTLAPSLGLSAYATAGQVDTDFSTLGIRAERSFVGAAGVTWAVTDSLNLSLGVSRRLGDLPSVNLGPVLEDRVEGAVRYSITPKLAVSARGSMATSYAASDQSPVSVTPPDEAEFNAAFFITPRLVTGVNYLYESYEGEDGKLSNDQTLFLTLKGKF